MSIAAVLAGSRSFYAIGQWIAVPNYIPNVGFIIGLVPPALPALLEGGPRLMVKPRPIHLHQTRRQQPPHRRPLRP